MKQRLDGLLRHDRFQVEEEGRKHQRRGYLLELGGEGATAATMRRHGVEWPPDPLPDPGV